MDDVNPQPMDVETPDDPVDVSSKFQKATDAVDELSNDLKPQTTLAKTTGNLTALKIEVSSCSSTPSAPTTPNTMNLSDKNISHGGVSDLHNLSGTSLHTSALNSSNPSIPHAHRTHTLSSSSSSNFVSNQTIPLEQIEKFIGKDPRLKQTSESSSCDSSEYFKSILERLNGKTQEINFVLPKFTVGEAEKTKSSSSKSNKGDVKHHGSTDSPGVIKSELTKSRILSISETVKKDMSSIAIKGNQKKIQVIIKKCYL